MKKQSKIYLAIPYSWNTEQSYQIVNKVAAKLLLDNYIVYSPISHSHSIAKDHALPKNWDFWANLDQEFITWCNTVIVVNIGKDGLSLIRNSEGVQAELEFAKKLGKNIEYYKYEKD